MWLMSSKTNVKFCGMRWHAPYWIAMVFFFFSTWAGASLEGGEGRGGRHVYVDATTAMSRHFWAGHGLSVLAWLLRNPHYRFPFLLFFSPQIIHTYYFLPLTFQPHTTGRSASVCVHPRVWGL